MWSCVEGPKHLTRLLDTMTPGVLILLLLAAGAVLLAAELFLPTQGILAVLGGAALLAAVVVAFRIQPWLGAGLLAAILIASPFAATAAINLWPKTPFGRRIVLSPPESHITATSVIAGQRGVAVSELRPGGEIEIDGARHEAQSDRGLIRAGDPIRVLGIIDGRIVVRAVDVRETQSEIHERV